MQRAILIFANDPLALGVLPRSGDWLPDAAFIEGDDCFLVLFEVNRLPHILLNFAPAFGYLLRGVNAMRD